MPIKATTPMVVNAFEPETSHADNLAVRMQRPVTGQCCQLLRLSSDRLRPCGPSLPPCGRGHDNHILRDQDRTTMSTTPSTSVKEDPVTGAPPATTTRTVSASVEDCTSGAHTLVTSLGMFPIVPSVRPPCPAVSTRIAQVRDLTRQVQCSAKADPDAGTDARAAFGSGSRAEPRPVLRTTARALNLAALIASDCRDDGLFERIAWDHVNTYLAVCAETGRRLDEDEATCLLVPLTAIARVRLRESNPRSGVRALTRLLAALRSRTEVTLEGRTLHLGDLLPLPHPTGDAAPAWDKQAIRWMSRQLVAHGSSALMAAGRWSEAENLVRSRKSIGPGLGEGRQAAILGRCSAGDLASARRLLSDATLTTGWEHQVSACLRLMVATRSERDHAAMTLAEMFTQARNDSSREGIEARSRLAATAAHLLALNQHPSAATLAATAADQVLVEPNGYAARYLLHSPTLTALLPASQAKALTAILTETGLTGEAFNTEVRRRLSDATYTARQVLAHALKDAR